jgi:hypothetical protein
MEKPSWMFVKNLLIRMMYLLGAAIMAVLALFFISYYNVYGALKCADCGLEWKNYTPGT